MGASASPKPALVSDQAAARLDPAGFDPARGDFSCGHARTGRNSLRFKNGGRTSSRCRQCHNAFQKARQAAGRRALSLVLRLYREGVLSEGQVQAETGLDRIQIRTLADAQRDSDGTATAAACEDMPVPKDCQARAEGIAQEGDA